MKHNYVTTKSTPSTSQQWDIPSHWKLLPNRALFFECAIKGSNLELPLLSVTIKQGVLRQSDFLKGSSKKDSSNEDKAQYKLVQPNDLAYNKMRMWQGAVGRSDYSGLVSPAYIVLSPRRHALSNYYHYVFRLPEYSRICHQYSYGICDDQLSLRYKDFKVIYSPVPPIEEQQAIVRFLDHKCGLINRFICNKRRLIERLKEQKQAIMNQAVTRGLDLNVKLKPSGVPWLGNIPKHWEIRRLQNLAKIQASGIDKHVRDEEIPVKLCNYVDVYKNDRITSDICFSSGSATANEIAAFELKQGDLIVTKDSEDWQDIAVPAFVPDDLTGMVCGYHLALIRTRAEDISGEYLFWTFLAKSINIQYQLASKGVTRFGLSLKDLKRASIPTPPIKEQRAIVKYLGKKNREIQRLITNTENQVQLCQEYRQRLIADAVTGKIDVRNIQIPDDLVDEPEEIFDNDFVADSDVELIEEVYADD